MTVPPWRTGLVGATGLVARVYLNAALDVPELDLQAIAARHIGPLRETAAAYGDPAVYTDWRELVARDDLDLVIVATDNGSHHPIALGALRAGRHVLCEKPMATSAADGREMFTVARATGLAHGVAHLMRFGEPIVVAKQMVDAGELGDVRAVVGHIWQARPAHEPLQWFMRAAANPAGSLGVLGVHKLDLARHLTGGEVTRVFAHLPTMVRERPDLGDISRREAAEWAAQHDDGSSLQVPQGAVGASDVSWLHAEMESGALVTVSAGQSNFTRSGPIPDVEIHGTAASLFVFFDASNRRGGRLLLNRGRSRETEPVDVRTFPNARVHNAHIMAHYALPGLVAAQAARPHPMATFYDGWKLAEVVDAALQSHRLGRWVDVGNHDRDDAPATTTSGARQ